MMNYVRRLKERLKTPKGKALSKERGYQVETVFGDRKSNQRNKRFHLRGLWKVKIESGLFYTTYNFRKIYKQIIENIIKIKENLMKKKGIKEILSIT